MSTRGTKHNQVMRNQICGVLQIVTELRRTRGERDTHDRSKQRHGRNKPLKNQGRTSISGKLRSQSTDNRKAVATPTTITVIRVSGGGRQKPAPHKAGKSIKRGKMTRVLIRQPYSECLAQVTKKKNSRAWGRDMGGATH